VIKFIARQQFACYSGIEQLAGIAEIVAQRGISQTANPTIVV